MAITNKMTKREILDAMELLIHELADKSKQRYVTDGPVGTTLDVIKSNELSPTQRLIMLYLLFEKSVESVPQREIVESLGFSNKCVRENMEAMLSLGYVKRGTKVYTWDPK